MRFFLLCFLAALPLFLGAPSSQAQAAGREAPSYDGVILPKVNFREASLSSVLDLLRQQVEEVTEGGTLINFVAQLPPEKLAQKISLSLQNVPLPAVLKYVGELAGVQFVSEQYAIVVKPLTKVAPADTAQ